MIKASLILFTFAFKINTFVCYFFCNAIKLNWELATSITLTLNLVCWQNNVCILIQYLLNQFFVVCNKIEETSFPNTLHSTQRKKLQFSKHFLLEHLLIKIEFTNVIVENLIIMQGLISGFFLSSWVTNWYFWSLGRKKDSWQCFICRIYLELRGFFL